MGLPGDLPPRIVVRITYLERAYHGGWYIQYFLGLLLMLQLSLKPNLTLSFLCTRSTYCPLLPPRSGWAFLSASPFSLGILGSTPPRCTPVTQDLPEVSCICHILSDISASYQVTWNAIVQHRTETLAPEYTWASLRRPYIKPFLYPVHHPYQVRLSLSPWHLPFSNQIHEVLSGTGPPRAQHSIRHQTAT